MMLSHDEDENILLIQRLQSSHAYLMQKQEAERKQTADYFNDTAVQTLTALHMQMSMLLNYALSEEQMHTQVGELLTPIKDLMENMIMEARRLRPLELDTVGLNAALQQASKEFSQLMQIPVQYKGAEVSFLPEAVTMAFYRLGQEAFANILKYAQPTQGQVSLQSDGRTVTLTITDNGQGLSHLTNIATPIAAPGLTLFSLMVYLQALDGHVTIQSVPGKGATVTAVWPAPNLVK